MALNSCSDLKHKVVLVTGSNSGIGEAIVALFSRLGAQVVVTGRNEDKVSGVALKCEQLSPFKHKPLTFVGDLMRDENIEQLVKKTVEKYSKIDVVVNNSGCDVEVFTSSLLDADFLENYEKAMRLDLGVTVKICRLTMPYLIESKGAIVNTSSVYAKKPGVSFLLHSISKAAIDMATKSLALEFGPKGVRVNSVNPGIIKTPASQPYLEDENYLKEAKNYSVFQRVGEVDDIAKAVVFLASNASSFITGTNLPVDGGFLLK